ncbi:Cof-type HAD-IIB family hydrolase [Terrihalobacillus insolitus]|uniref:Cof-type HAD-IIB family hydrolase n=1 Tax=Terrihalobacillus insolitus TaxID=2950438 RepID=UPI002341E8BB|nr:Cof-type HAD-IIB family hydrolase [Terrihalobacillus insolitus]MDC3413478.1 Cof-type HAD-IIB family hydrolase [Terrihalobacillus insolitus]
MSIELIALDMDGTLLNSKEEVSAANRQAINKVRERGVEVVLSTGRHIMTSREYAKELNLSSYLITVNGSEIWTTKGELIDRQLIDLDSIKKLVELNEKYQTIAWITSAENVWRGKLPADLESHKWLKFGFNTDNQEMKDRILEELQDNEFLELSNSSPTNIEINAVGINKARALEKVCSRMGITLDKVMAMGDSLNDIKMIEEAGLGIAMGNAQEKVKEAADWVTNTNEEDGVARAIEHWLL